MDFARNHVNILAVGMLYVGGGWGVTLLKGRTSHAFLLVWGFELRPKWNFVFVRLDSRRSQNLPNVTQSSEIRQNFPKLSESDLVETA